MKPIRSIRLVAAARVLILAVAVEAVVSGQPPVKVPAPLSPEIVRKYFDEEFHYLAPAGETSTLRGILADGAIGPRLVTIDGRSWALTPDLDEKIVEANAEANTISKALEQALGNRKVFAASVIVLPSAGERPSITSSVGTPLIEDLSFPRFQQADVGPTVAAIVPAATTLLIPFAVRDLGFDTGIALSNTTADPFGVPLSCKASVTLDVSMIDATDVEVAVVNFTNDGACDVKPESMSGWIRANRFEDTLAKMYAGTVRKHGTIDLLFLPNTTGRPRVGTVLIGDQVLTVTQRPRTDDTPLRTPTELFIDRPSPVAPYISRPREPGDTVRFTLGIGDGTPMLPVMLNPEPVQLAPPNESAQNTVLSYMDNAVLMIRSVPSPSVDWKGVLAALVGPTRPRLASAAIAGPRAPSWRRQTSSAPTQDAPRLKVFVTSLGQLGANAFRVVVVNDGGAPVALRLRDLALEPVARLTEKDVERELASLARLPQRAITVDGYCLQREKTAPAAGVVYRVASADAQAKNAPVSRVLQAAQRLRDRKALTPDTDPDEYYHSVVQWAIWTTQEKFDRRAFDSAFVTHARKNVVGAGERWSREIEDAVKEIAPHRWRDVSKIVDEARKESPKE